MNFEKFAAEFVTKTQNQNRLTLKSVFGEDVYEKANSEIFKETDELALKLLKQNDKCNNPCDFTAFQEIGFSFTNIPATSSSSEAAITSTANDENKKPTSRLSSRDSIPRPSLVTNQNSNSSSDPSSDELFSQVTDEEYKAIPKYMKGSLTLLDLNIMLKKLEEVMRNNWNLRRQNLNKLQPKEKDSVILMREELNTLKLSKDAFFCHEAQWTAALDIKFRTKVRTARPCYRHLNRTKEVTQKGKVYIMPA